MAPRSRRDKDLSDNKANNKAIRVFAQSEPGNSRGSRQGIGRSLLYVLIRLFVNQAKRHISVFGMGKRVFPLVFNAELPQINEKSPLLP